MEQKAVKKILKGDKEAFRELYQEHADKALRVAVGIIQNKDLAKDAVQETFIRVYRNIEKYDTALPFEPWFYRILTNECNRILKREANKLLIDREKMENAQNLSESRDEQADDVNEAIAMLEEEYRIPVVLKYIKGFTEKEIAETLEMNQNTVKTKLYKGRERLKEKLRLSEDGGA